MGFLKKLASVFGFGQEDDGGDNTGIGDDEDDNKPRFRETGLPRKGFGVPVQVSVERSYHLGPVLQPCNAKDGGIQGLKWYTKRLKIDEDGDVADEFLEEDGDDHKMMLATRLESKPAKVRGLVVSSDGKLQQCIEHQGRLVIV